MKKTLLIVSREYLTRIKKSSFVVMTILGPLLMAALIIVPVYIAKISEKEVKVAVVDDNDYFINAFSDTKKITFSYYSGNIDNLKKSLLDDGYDAVLHILSGNQSNRGNLYFREEPSMSLRGRLEDQMNKILFDKTLKDSFNIDTKKFEDIKAHSMASIAQLQIDENGNEKKSFTELNRAIGIICGFLIYIFVFMFASQVLRSVLEEKTNRIVEVLISSVKPMQLMIGKIVGVALVGLTQFLLWILLTIGILFFVQISSPDFFVQNDIESMMGQNNDMMQTVNAQTTGQPDNIIDQVRGFYPFSFSALIFCFFFYFLLGYLVYASLFAAVGSAVDNETDSQQFTLPVTIPLILTILLIMPIAEAPHGGLAWWMSMIPLTSPVAMLIRIPSGVPVWELLLSMGILVLFFIFSAWFASKIYRTGILMYGKKISYKELFKWLRYR